jgi:nucleotide-binding universal stress UspA family protein
MMDRQSSYKPMRILLAIDGSEHAYAAVEFIRELPLPTGSEISVTAVLIPRDAANHAGLQAVLDQSQAMLKKDGVEVKTELLVGYPSEMLSEFADQYQPDLIALGAKGLRATLGILLGGVAQQMVEYAHCPVLVVRAPYRGIKRILFVTDGSEYSQRALKYLTQFPIPKEAEVHVMHVLPPLYTSEMIVRSWPIGTEVLPPISSQEAEEITSKQAEAEEAQGKTLLKQSLETLQQHGIEASSVLRRGDAATEIIEYAKTQDIHLIIAGSRGLSRIKSWLLGSVSRKLLHYSNTSVLIVKTGHEP